MARFESCFSFDTVPSSFCSKQSGNNPNKRHVRVALCSVHFLKYSRCASSPETLAFIVKCKCHSNLFVCLLFVYMMGPD